jgi:hypothetical protein
VDQHYRAHIGSRPLQQREAVFNLTARLTGEQVSLLPTRVDGP